MFLILLANHKTQQKFLDDVISFAWVVNRELCEKM